ncbi:MAG TPA: PEGA domain-containing protein [Candidatus Dormibacteraeota bacterium]|nr:PEGA domain-containing protein [Candidatus Dormibacteraeota bacterium]
MQPSRRPCIYASFALLLLLAAPRTFAKNLIISSTPPGARVEINGMFAGTTPYTSHFPGGYFHKPHTVFGARLDHAITLHVSKDGYLPEKITITNGPYQWVSINGRKHGNYFLLKSSHIDIKLDPLSAGSGRPTETVDGEGPLAPPRAAEEFDDDPEHRGGTGRLAINSDPSGAEIYVDGQFEGQTPATLRLKSGLHHIEVRFSAKQRWERDLDVLKDSKLSLSASKPPAP